MRIVGFFVFAFFFLWALGIGSAWVVSLTAAASLLGAGAVMWVGVAICAIAFELAIKVLDDIL